MKKKESEEEEAVGFARLFGKFDSLECATVQVKQWLLWSVKLAQPCVSLHLSGRIPRQETIPGLYLHNYQSLLAMWSKTSVGCCKDSNYVTNWQKKKDTDQRSRKSVKIYLSTLDITPDPQEESTKNMSHFPQWHMCKTCTVPSSPTSLRSLPITRHTSLHAFVFPRIAPVGRCSHKALFSSTSEGLPTSLTARHSWVYPSYRKCQEWGESGRGCEERCGR